MAETNGIASAYDLMYHFSHFLTETTDTLTSTNTSYRNSITAYTNSLAKYIWNKCGQSYSNSAAQYVPTKSYILDNYTYSYNSSSGMYTTYVRIKNENNYSDHQAVKIEDISYGTIRQGYPINRITFNTTSTAVCDITYTDYFPTKSYEFLLGQINIYGDTTTTLQNILQDPNLVYGYCAMGNNIYDINVTFTQGHPTSSINRVYAYITIDYPILSEYDCFAYVVAKIPTTLSGNTYAVASRRLNVRTPIVQTISKANNFYVSYYMAHTDNSIILRLNYSGTVPSGVNYEYPIFSYIDFALNKYNDNTYSRYSLDEAIDNLQISTNATGINVRYPLRFETTNISLFDVIKKKKFGIEKEGFSLHTYVDNVRQEFDSNLISTYVINNIYSYEYPTSVSISYTGTPIVNNSHKFKLGINPGTAYGMDYAVTYSTTYFNNFSVSNVNNGAYLDSFLTPQKSGITTVDFKVFTSNYANCLSDTKTVVIHYSLYNNLHFTSLVESSYIESMTNDSDYFTSDTLFIPNNVMLDQTSIEIFYLTIPYSTENNGDSYFILHVKLIFNINCYVTLRYEIEKPNDGNTVTLTKIDNDEYGEHNITFNKEIIFDTDNITMHDPDTGDEIDGVNNDGWASIAKLIGDASINIPVHIILRTFADQNNLDFQFKIFYGIYNPGTGNDDETEYNVYIEPSEYSSNQIRLDFICSENVENITITNIRCDEHMCTTSFARINDLSWYMTLHTPTEYDTCMYYVDYRINDEIKTYTQFVSLGKLLS